METVPGYPDVEALLLSKEITHYRNAKSTFISANNINTKVLLQAHQHFYSSKFKMGQFRTTQNWIGESIERAVYLPPPPEKLASLLQDWCELSNARVHTAEHAIECYVRLLAIHPFPDANGRVARALLDAMTHRITEGYLPLVMYKLGISPEISRAGYKSFGILTNEKAQHSYWQASVNWAKTTKTEAQKIINKTHSTMSAKLGVFSMTPEELRTVESLWKYPTITPKKLQHLCKWHAEFCHELLQKLCDAGLLTTKKLKHDKNHIVFICEDIFRCFEAVDALFLNKRK